MSKKPDGWESVVPHTSPRPGGSFAGPDRGTALTLWGEPVPSEPHDWADEWTEWYNREYKHAFRCARPVRTAIAGLVKRGATLADLQLVTRFLWHRWHGTPKMEAQHIPEVITRPMKWQGRLDQALEWQRLSEATTQPAKVRPVALEPPPSDVVPADELVDIGTRLLRRLR